MFTKLSFHFINKKYFIGIDIYLFPIILNTMEDHSSNVVISSLLNFAQVRFSIVLMASLIMVVSSKSAKN